MFHRIVVGPEENVVPESALHVKHQHVFGALQGYGHRALASTVP